MNARAQCASTPVCAALAVIVAALMPACSSAPHDTKAQQPLAAYSWLLGEWLSDSGDQRIHESWRAAAPDLYSGTGSTEDRHSGERKGFEQLQLVARDGRIFYVANVAQNPAPVAFALTSDDPYRLVFTNPQHDFPRKIVYELVAEEELRVEVSDGGERGFALNFTRLHSAQ